MYIYIYIHLQTPPELSAIFRDLSCVLSGRPWLRKWVLAETAIKKTMSVEESKTWHRYARAETAG